MSMLDSTDRGRGRVPDNAYRPAGSAGGIKPAWVDARSGVESVPHEVTVMVIGAGQSGLAMAHELLRKGFRGFAEDPDHQQGFSDRPHAGTFIVVDAEVRPGGAWQHRWPSLTMATVNGIADLPGMPWESIDPKAEAAQVVPEYFTAYEDAFDLPILRPVLVKEVANAPDGRIKVTTTAGTWLAEFVVNCTGTWTRPFVPYVPGIDRFRGRQLHTQVYHDPEEFRRQRVMIVGGGISALEHLREISPVANVVRWVTRTPPRWRDDLAEGKLSADVGRAIEAKVTRYTDRGLPPRPVVENTGLPLTAKVRRMAVDGLLRRHPMFDRLDRHGAWWGEVYEEFDAIVWATGFRYELRHLAPLKLRSPRGGIALDGTRARRNDRVYFIGYGASASTIGARNYARITVRDIAERLGR